MSNSSPFIGTTGILQGSPEPSGFYGPYRGIVTNTTDPASQSRIKAVVPQLFGNASTECDWALPCQLPGLQSVPSPGQGVWIMFEGGDINYPVYMGMWQAEPSVAPYDVAGAASAAQAASDPLGAAAAAQAAAEAASDPVGSAAAAQTAAITTSEAYTTAQLAAYVPLSGNPWARAWATGTSSIGSGSGVTINLAGFDLHNGFTSGTNSLIVPVAGTYQVSGAVNSSSTSNGIQAQIIQAGTQMTGFGVYSQSTSCLLACNAGDAITLKAFNNTGGSVTFGSGSNGSILQAVLVAR